MPERTRVTWKDLESPWTIASVIIATLLASAFTNLAGWGGAQVAVACWAAGFTVIDVRALWLFGLLLHEAGRLND